MWQKCMFNMGIVFPGKQAGEWDIDRNMFENIHANAKWKNQEWANTI